MITKKKKWYIKLLVIIAVCLGALFSAFPVLWMLSNSFKLNPEIFAFPPVWISENSSLASYIAVLTNPVQMRFFLNSYLIAMIVVVFTLIVGIMASYSFSRFQFKGKGLINTVVVSVQAIPPITLMIPYLTLTVFLRIYNTHLGLVLTYMLFTLPYAILLLTGYMNTMPKDLDEAVLIDGGSRWRALWTVLVPNAVPGLIAVGMYTFMLSWNEFLFALTLTRTNDMRTVPVGINLLMGQHGFEWNQMMAMSILGSLPVLVLFLFFQRYFIAGMTAGAVKQ